MKAEEMFRLALDDHEKSLGKAHDGSVRFICTFYTSGQDSIEKRQSWKGLIQSPDSLQRKTYAFSDLQI